MDNDVLVTLAMDNQAYNTLRDIDFNVKIMELIRNNRRLINNFNLIWTEAPIATIFDTTTTRFRLIQAKIH